MQTWPYFRARESREAMLKNHPVPVTSCWNGIGESRYCCWVLPSKKSFSYLFSSQWLTRCVPMQLQCLLGLSFRVPHCSFVAFRTLLRLRILKGLNVA
jgi:hypothetical protein